MIIKELKESALKPDGTWNNGINSDDLLELFNYAEELENKIKKLQSNWTESVAR